MSKEKKPRWGFFSKRSPRHKEFAKQAMLATMNDYVAGRAAKREPATDRGASGRWEGWQKLLAEQKRMQAEARAQTSDEGVPAYGEVDGKR